MEKFTIAQISNGWLVTDVNSGVVTYTSNLSKFFAEEPSAKLPLTEEKFERPDFDEKFINSLQYLVNNNRLVDAVKEIRAVSGYGLKEAIDVLRKYTSYKG
jgi:ribosomal protein L7/L12